jgi:hypothetical protein
MKIRSTTLGILILLVLFGIIAISILMGWWQTNGNGRRNRLHGEVNNGAPYITLTPYRATIPTIGKQFHINRITLSVDSYALADPTPTPDQFSDVVLQASYDQPTSQVTSLCLKLPRVNQQLT